jgi:hypothetical protein
MRKELRSSDAHRHGADNSTLLARAIIGPIVSGEEGAGASPKNTLGLARHVTAEHSYQSTRSPIMDFIC